MIALLRALRGVYMPTAEKLVLVVLADHARADGLAFPSQEAIARETGLGLTKVGEAIRALARKGWLSRHRQLDGGRIWAHTVYQLRLDGEPWPPPARQPRGGDRVNRPADPQPPGTDAVNRPTGERQPSDADRVNRRAPTKLPEEKLTDQAPRREETQIAHPRGADRVGGQEQLLLVPPATSSPPAPPPAARSQSPKATKPKAADAYGQAWVDGHAAGGATVTRPTASGIACLGRAAAAHARYRDGERIAGDELVRWIRVKARRFREEVEDPTRQRGGMTPFGFVSWLDDDPGERAKPWRRPEERAAEAAAAKLPPPPVERPVYSLEHQELAIKFQRRLQGLEDLTPEALTKAAQDALRVRGSEGAAHG